MIPFDNFISDTHARIPFSILGICILLCSSFTSVYLSDIDTIQSDSLLSLPANKDILGLISNAETEISQMINVIGMKTLQEIGHNPVIISRVQGKTGEEINKLRFRKSFIVRLNPLLDEMFSENNYHNHRYAINIIKENNESYIINDPSTVIIQPIQMILNRPVHIPLIGPDEKEEFDTYWSISIPITFQITDRKDQKMIGHHQTTISRVITSRFPLLYHLTKDFNETINGLGPLWGFFTSIVNIYSLVRGYRHYQSGRPRNVVDNTHLVPLINTGLLFEQGLCFGSIDPYTIIELLKHCRKTLLNQNSTDQIETINSLNTPSVNILTSWFTEANSQQETSDESTHGKLNTDINISNIAESILYDTIAIKIIFKNEKTGELFSTTLRNMSEKDVQDYIARTLDNHTSLYNIKPLARQFNSTTLKKMGQIVNQTYTVRFNTRVKRDPDPVYYQGPHDGFPIDNGTTDWQLTDYSITAMSGKPMKGKIRIGDPLYTEKYNVTWIRNHFWSNKEISVNGNNTTTTWSYHTTQDKKIESNVTLQIILKEIGLTSSINDPIHDVFYENLLLNDMNLEDTVPKYKNTMYFPNVHKLISFSNGGYFDHYIQGEYRPWVMDECRDALNDILMIMKSITVDNHINATRYPNPLVLLTKSKDNLLEKFQQQIPDMNNKPFYMYNDEFSSTGKKAVFSVRSWFIDFTNDYIQTIFRQMEQQMASVISTKSDANGFTNQEHVLTHLDGQDDGMVFADSFSIPFGISMDLSSLPDSSGTPWNESIQLSIHQKPAYLSPFYQQEYEGKKEYFLGVRNICTLGPTGLPILPITPTTPWIISLNIWVISIRGSYAEFTVADGNDETIPHPLFGHNTQTMIRKNKDIYDEHGNLIGLNTRISFSLDTLSFSLVPSWGMMIGDTEKNLVEEHGFE